jgi:hypothetical protein
MKGVEIFEQPMPVLFVNFYILGPHWAHKQDHKHIPSKDTASQDETHANAEFPPELGRPKGFFSCMSMACGIGERRGYDGS